MERDAPQEPGSKFGPGESVFTKELFQIIPVHMMNREIIPGRKKRVRGCPLQSVTVVDILISSVKVVSHACMAEAKRRGWLLAGVTHSTSQG